MGEEPFLNWNASPIVLIDGAQPGGQMWLGATYTDKKQYFDALEQVGLATVETDNAGNMVSARIKPTQRGRELLESIGMSLNPVQPKSE